MSILNNVQLKKVQLSSFNPVLNGQKVEKNFLKKDHLKNQQLNTLILE